MERSDHADVERRSVKATAAHIAFSAPSRSAVNTFFTAALKAGGRIHGEPAVRDQETGYYSAAILDFDDNSIEAMHREHAPERSARSDVSKEDQRVLSWQQDVARSSVVDGSQVEKPASRIMINNITTPTTVVSRVTPTAKEDREMNAKQLVGTLLGAAAGAAVAYAMTKGEVESLRSPTTQTITYQTIDANSPRRTPSVHTSRRSYPPSSVPHLPRTALRELEYPNASLPASGSDSPFRRLLGPNGSTGRLIASTLIDTFVPPPEIRSFPPHAIVRSQTDSIVSRSASNHLSHSAWRQSQASHTTSAFKQITQPDQKSSSRSPAITEIRMAREVALPHSSAASHVSRHSASSRQKDLDMKSEMGSVAPSDSVSQAGSRRSKDSRRSTQNGRSKSGLDVVREDRGSRVSERTVMDRGSRPRRRRESAISLPMRPSSKASVHRSVKSFIPGL